MYLSPFVKNKFTNGSNRKNIILGNFSKKAQAKVFNMLIFSDLEHKHLCSQEQNYSIK